MAGSSETSEQSRSLVTDKMVEKARSAYRQVRRAPVTDERFTVHDMRAALEAVEGDIIEAFGVAGSECLTELPQPEQSADAAFRAALRAGDDAHLLTIGSPTRGLAFRVTLGNLNRHGHWQGWRPCMFLIWRGRRI